MEDTKTFANPDEPDRILDFFLTLIRYFGLFSLRDLDTEFDLNDGRRKRFKSVHMTSDSVLSQRKSYRKYLIILVLICSAIYVAFALVMGDNPRRRLQHTQLESKRSSQNGTCVKQSDQQRTRMECLPRMNTATQFLYLLNMFIIITLIFSDMRLYNRRPTRIHSLCFLINPEEERMKVHSKLMCLAKKLFNNPEASEQYEKILASNCICGQARLCNRFKSRRMITGQQVGSSSQNRAQFLEMLQNMQSSQLVVPGNLSEENRKVYRVTFRMSFLMGAISSYTLAIVSGIYVNLNQLESIATSRFENLKCERAASNMSRWLHLAQRHWTFKELESSDRFELIALEFKLQLFSTCFWSRQLHLITIIMIAGCWALFCFVVLSTEFHFQLVWLTYLRSQISHLRRLMKNASRGANSIDQHHYYLDLESKSSLEIHEALASGYLNFELFRRQYKDSRRLGNYISTIYLMIAFGYTFCTYTTLRSANAQSYSTIFFLIGSSLVGVINVIFICSSLIVVTIHRISKSLTFCLASAAKLSISESYIVSLWRRQLMTNSDFRSCYSLSMFSFEMSPANLVTFNSYLLGFGLILYSNYK